jgi:hypothetical protein
VPPTARQNVVEEQDTPLASTVGVGRGYATEPFHFWATEPEAFRPTARQVADGKEIDLGCRSWASWSPATWPLKW